MATVPLGKWFVEHGEHEAGWGRWDEHESACFSRTVLVPRQLRRVDCDGLSFRHRNGQYWAALDQFYVNASALSDAAWVVNTEVLGIVTGLSDHAPVVCRARLLPRGQARRLADSTVRHPLFRKTYQSELDFQCGRRTGKAYCTKDKSGNGKIRRNPLLGALHAEEWDWHGCASRAASKAVRACPPQQG